jgi:hypothetical protein
MPTATYCLFTIPPNMRICVHFCTVLPIFANMLNNRRYGKYCTFGKYYAMCFSPSGHWPDCKTKGSLTRDFQLQVLFTNHCPRLEPLYPIRNISIFRKLAEIFANECLSTVSTTPAIKEKKF